jgi:hypothetical protein
VANHGDKANRIESYCIPARALAVLNMQKQTNKNGARRGKILTSCRFVIDLQQVSCPVEGQLWAAVDRSQEPYDHETPGIVCLSAVNVPTGEDHLAESVPV